MVGLPGFLLAGAVVWRSRPDAKLRLSMSLVLAEVFLDLFRATARAASTAAQDQSGTSKALVLQRSATAVLAVPAVIVSGLVGLAAAFLVGSVVGCLAHARSLHRLGLKVEPKAAPEGATAASPACPASSWTSSSGSARAASGC